MGHYPSTMGNQMLLRVIIRLLKLGLFITSTKFTCPDKYILFTLQESVYGQQIQV